VGVVTVLITSAKAFAEVMVIVFVAGMIRSDEDVATKYYLGSGLYVFEWRWPLRIVLSV